MNLPSALEGSRQQPDRALRPSSKSARAGRPSGACSRLQSPYQSRTPVLRTGHCDLHRSDISLRFPDVSGDSPIDPGVISVPSLSQRIRHSRGTPIAALLVVALALVALLGYEAIDSAASHRRTAEAVLRDYALVSATQLAGFVRNELDNVIDVVLVPVLRSGDLTSPASIGRRMDNGAREAGCECPSLQSPLFLFRVDPSGAVTVVPDNAPSQMRERLAALVTVERPQAVNPRSGLVTSPGGDLLDQPVAVGFLIAEDENGAHQPTFGFVVSTVALEELFLEWYNDQPLLPEAIVGDVPNDSVLHVTIEAPGELVVFASSVPRAGAPGASVPIREGSRFGNLVVHATVRPEAADRLIIGGLPNSRLPLLAALLLLTLGVGAAAFVQLREEQGFQRLREDFVSSVSHELRTPLAQIRMFSELQEAGKLPSQEDRERATSIIAREAQRLSHLIDNILQFSSLGRTSGQTMRRDRLDLSDAISEGLDSVTHLLKASDMRLDVTLEPNVWVHANGQALTRIVVNLLDNAIKYGAHGQTLKVDVSRTDGFAKLSVEDEGPGIPVADRDRIWKAYRRLDRDVRTQVQGSGIGLSVVSELASLHGGRVWVEEGDGGGARFVLELPLVERSVGADERVVAEGAAS